jgi:hypothetical protein
MLIRPELSSVFGFLDDEAVAPVPGQTFSERTKQHQRPQINKFTPAALNG